MSFLKLKLLGLSICEALSIVQINLDDKANTANGDVKKVTEGSTEYIDANVSIEERRPIGSREDLKKMYPECFEQKGKCFKTFEHEIKIDPTVKPRARRVLFELKDKLKAKLDELIEKEIISRVEEPTRWVNSLVV